MASVVLSKNELSLRLCGVMTVSNHLSMTSGSRNDLLFPIVSTVYVGARLYLDIVLALGGKTG